MTLRSFLTRAPKTTTNLRSAYDAKDYVKLRRDAHSLKGACGYVASEHETRVYMLDDEPAAGQ